MRIVAHACYMALSIDRFSAQVIAAYHPELSDVPFVVVRQAAESHKSHVWSCSLAALDRRVHPGMPVPLAVKRCPGLKVLPRDEALEKTVCRELNGVLFGYTPEYEVSASGACLANLTGTPLLEQVLPTMVAEEVQEAIAYRIGLEEVAAGLAGSRLIARLMAKLAMPDGVRMCGPGDEGDTLASLDTSLLPGLSSACRGRLKAYGLKRIGQVRQLGRDALVARLGSEGERLYSLSLGMDSGGNQKWVGVKEAPAVYEATFKDVVAETVLNRDINDQDVLIQQVRFTADKLSFELASKGLWTKRVTFVLTYTDRRSVQRTASWPTATNEFPRIAETAVLLFTALYQRRVAIKSFRLTGRAPRRDPGQLNLLETPGEQKQRKAAGAITEVRKRMGFSSVVSAAHMKESDFEKAEKKVKIEFDYGR